MAAEKTKGLADMLVTRREYLKEKKASELSSRGRVGGKGRHWFSSNAASSPKREKSNPFILQLRQPTLQQNLPTRTSDGLNIPHVNTGKAASTGGGKFCTDKNVYSNILTKLLF